MALYTTYFDSNYLLRGATCIRSIVEHSKKPARFLVLALDEDCSVNLPRLLPDIADQIEIVKLADLEKKNPELLTAKAGRSKVEYIFTLTPILCELATQRVKTGDVAVYFDADMYFYADGALAIAELGQNDVAITEHRFVPQSMHLLAYGRFNVGWLAFRHNANTLKCLARWRAQCLEHCSLTLSDKGFGDQKYLDEWPETVKNLVIVSHPGVNTAPWNAANYTFSGAPASPLVDGKPVVVFHFHNLKKLREAVYEAHYDEYGAIPPSLLPAYGHYLRALTTTEHQAQASHIPVERLAQPKYFALGRLGRFLHACIQSLTGRRVVFESGYSLPMMKSLTYVR